MRAQATATTIPLVIPAKVKAKIISMLLRGGIKRSTILPWTLDINIEEELFIKAFWIIVIIINPGNKNDLKSVKIYSFLELPIAVLKITINNNVVAAGAKIVWPGILVNLLSSLIYKVTNRI